MCAQVIVAVSAEAGPGPAAWGGVADRLTEAFVEAGEAMLRVEPGGAVLLRCTTGEDSATLAGAVASLCRTMAREAAPRGVRVNAILADPQAEIDELIAFL